MRNDWMKERTVSYYILIFVMLYRLTFTIIYGRFLLIKKFQFFLLELENVSRILSKKIGSFYAQEQVENKSFWWPTAFLQTVGHFGHLLTPAVKQLV